MVVALYGMLKAGGAYLPLDPDLPAGAAGAILADSGLEVVLAQQGLDGAAAADWAGEGSPLTRSGTRESPGVQSAARCRRPRTWPT